MQNKVNCPAIACMLVKIGKQDATILTSLEPPTFSLLAQFVLIAL